MDLTLVKAVISTLNCIEVRGRDNLDYLLGSINALESFVHLAEKTQESIAKEEPNG